MCSHHHQDTKKSSKKSAKKPQASGKAVGFTEAIKACRLNLQCCAKGWEGGEWSRWTDKPRGPIINNVKARLDIMESALRQNDMYTPLEAKTPLSKNAVEIMRHAHNSIDSAVSAPQERSIDDIFEATLSWLEERMRAAGILPEAVLPEPEINDVPALAQGYGGYPDFGNTPHPYTTAPRHYTPYKYTSAPTSSPVPTPTPTAARAPTAAPILDPLDHFEWEPISGEDRLAPFTSYNNKRPFEKSSSADHMTVDFNFHAKINPDGSREFGGTSKTSGPAKQVASFCKSSAGAIYGGVQVDGRLQRSGNDRLQLEPE